MIESWERTHLWHSVTKQSQFLPSDLRLSHRKKNRWGRKKLWSKILTFLTRKAKQEMRCRWTLCDRKKLVKINKWMKRNPRQQNLKSDRLSFDFAICKHCEHLSLRICFIPFVFFRQSVRKNAETEIRSRRSGQLWPNQMHHRRVRPSSLAVLEGWRQCFQR